MLLETGCAEQGLAEGGGDAGDGVEGDGIVIAKTLTDFGSDVGGEEGGCATLK